MDLVRKQVVFNPEDPDQYMLLFHANKRKNFSGYIKRLIQRDLEGGSNNAVMVPDAPEPVVYELDGFI